MPQTRAAISSRVSSLCVAAGFVASASPFDFTHQPTGAIDGAFRLLMEHEEVIGGTAYTEEQTDRLTLWLARKQSDGLDGALSQLVADVAELRSQIVRDGSTGGGDYAVLDGGGVSFEHTAGQEFAVARLALPVNYEVQL
jgi:hypothetical protein